MDTGHGMTYLTPMAGVGIWSTVLFSGKEVAIRKNLLILITEVV
jgi:hypothetical protein